MSYTFDNNIPIYIQLVDIIKTDIVSGKLSVGSRLPSVRELAFYYKVNPNTMQKALLELESEKLIYTERTNGKYVTNDSKVINKAKEKLAKETVNEYLSSMNSIGITYEESIKYLQELGGK